MLVKIVKTTLETAMIEADSIEDALTKAMEDGPKNWELLSYGYDVAQDTPLQEFYVTRTVAQVAKVKAKSSDDAILKSGLWEDKQWQEVALDTFYHYEETDEFGNAK